MVLKEKRDKLDEMDLRILALLNDRFTLAEDIARYKDENGVPFHDDVREAEQMSKLAPLMEEIKKPYLKKIFKEIMHQSAEFQQAFVLRYGLLGRKLGHSFSPQIHKELGGYEFGLIEKEPEELEKFMTDKNFSGICVTIPYKRDVMKYCSSISGVSQATNSVNVVVKQEDGTLRGDNTDYYGFRYMVESADMKIKGMNCIILGTGGVSGTVKKALEDMGAASIVMISRTGKNNYENIAKQYGTDIIVNTTPVGMYPNNGEAPVDVTKFRKLKGVIDLIYNPLRTKLVLDAEAMGVPAIGGLKMLVAQAAKACNLFTGKEIADEEIERVTDLIRRQQENIAIIGMPGAGKTSMGKILALRIGKEFIDCDHLVKQMTGFSPAEIIEQDGEDAFRKIETEALKKALAKGNCVVATGGGVVERNINRSILRENSTVIYIKRDIKALPVKGRPVSQAQGLEAIYNRRNPKYEEWSDLQIENIGVGRTANKVANILGYERKEI